MRKHWLKSSRKWDNFHQKWSSFLCSTSIKPITKSIVKRTRKEIYRSFRQLFPLSHISTYNGEHFSVFNTVALQSLRGKFMRSTCKGKKNVGVSFWFQREKRKIRWKNFQFHTNISSVKPHKISRATVSFVGQDYTVCEYIKVYIHTVRKWVWWDSCERICV